MEKRGIQAGDTVGDGEEELDHEMGDGNDPNEQVVDKKMWDEDEDEEEQNQQEEENEFEKIARCLERRKRTSFKQKKMKRELGRKAKMIKVLKMEVTITKKICQKMMMSQIKT